MKKADTVGSVDDAEMAGRICVSVWSPAIGYVFTMIDPDSAADGHDVCAETHGSRCKQEVGDSLHPQVGESCHPKTLRVAAVSASNGRSFSTS